MWSDLQEGMDPKRNPVAVLLEALQSTFPLVTENRFTTESGHQGLPVRPEVSDWMPSPHTYLQAQMKVQRTSEDFHLALWL